MTATISHVADQSSKTVAEQLPGTTRHRVREVLGVVLRLALSLVFGLPLVFMIVSSF